MASAGVGGCDPRRMEKTLVGYVNNATKPHRIDPLKTGTVPAFLFVQAAPNSDKISSLIKNASIR